MGPWRPLNILLWLGNAAIALLVGASVIGVLHLRDNPPTTTAFMELAKREDPATGLPCESIEYQYVSREQISPHLGLAVVVAEDQRFLIHRGFDLRQIRKALREQEAEGNGGGAHLAIVALTAHAMDGDEQKAREAGCDDYDTKPVELPRLLGKIEALLAG